MFGQLSPVCAIVGGVLAQEIIKAVSQKDLPHNNFFFFSTLDGAGVVECIGHWIDCSAASFLAVNQLNACQGY